MPSMVPSSAVRNAVAMATAARHIDDEGGRPKLLELIDALDNTELMVAGLVLARIVGLSNTDEQLHGLGLQCTDDHVVML